MICQTQNSLSWFPGKNLMLTSERGCAEIQIHFPIAIECNASPMSFLSTPNLPKKRALNNIPIRPFSLLMIPSKILTGMTNKMTNKQESEYNAITPRSYKPRNKQYKTLSQSAFHQFPQSYMKLC